MIGGEAVTFDLELDTTTQKTSAKRVKLAGVVMDLKNKGTKFAKARRHLTQTERSLPLGKTPPSSFYPNKLTKKGLLGKLYKLPDHNTDGTIKLYIGATYSLINFKSESEPAFLQKKYTTVRFELNIYFDTDEPLEAVNITAAPKKQVLCKYLKVGFILDVELYGRPWDLEDFKQLMVLVKECTLKNGTYDWKNISTIMRKSQGDVRGFISVFVMKLINNIEEQKNIISDTHSAGRFTRKHLDWFVKRITDHRETPVIDASSTAGPQDVSSAVVGGLNASATSRTPLLNRTNNTTSDNIGFTEIEDLKKSAKDKSQSTRKRVKQCSKSNQMVDSITGTVTSTEPLLHLNTHQNFVAKNLTSWRKVPEVPGERYVNSVLGDVMSDCGDEAPAPGLTPSPDYGSVYKYLGSLLQGSSSPSLPHLGPEEGRILLYLLQDLQEDMGTRNLHIHKQFLLQRFFDFTGSKNTGRTPINPYKLKGFLLHLPEPQKGEHA